MISQCKRGHDTTDPNSRDSKRQCRQCKHEAARQRYHADPNYRWAQRYRELKNRLRRRIADKERRIAELERQYVQEVRGRNGESQDHQSDSRSRKATALFGSRQGDKRPVARTLAGI